MSTIGELGALALNEAAQYLADNEAFVLSRIEPVAEKSVDNIVAAIKRAEPQNGAFRLIEPALNHLLDNLDEEAHTAIAADAKAGLDWVIAWLREEATRLQHA